MLRQIPSLAEQLLQHHSQYNSNEQRFNHEAIALLLKQMNTDTWKNRQLFLVAGSDDLRALLSRLDLFADGSEAFIFMRPYIHAMVIYLRRDKGELQAYIFESQGLQLRYAPTRYALSALTDSFPFINIYLSSAELQPLNVNRGCTEFAFACLDYLILHGAEWMERLRTAESQALKDFSNTKLLAEGVYFTSLTANDLTLIYNRNISLLEKILAEQYSEDGKLNFAAISACVQEMQGMHLSNAEMSLSNIYNISVSLDASAVTVQVDEKSNFLMFSPDEWLPTQGTEFVLREDEDTQHKYDKKSGTLTFSAPTDTMLLSAFKKLPDLIPAYFAQHMRQQLALSTFSREVSRELEVAAELMKVIDEVSGGMDIRQVQFALRYLLYNRKSAIYVPSYNELLTSIDLHYYRTHGYQRVVFSMQEGDEHQVAVDVDLQQNPVRVAVYDSQSQEPLDDEFITRMSELLTGEKIVIEKLDSPFGQQREKWSCGVYVAANLLSVCGLSVALAAGDRTAIESLAKTCLRAFHLVESSESMLMVLATDFQLAVNQAENADEICKQALDCLMNTSNAGLALRRFLKLIDADYDVNLCEANYVRGYLLHSVMSVLNEAGNIATSEAQRLQLESQLRLQAIKANVVALGLTGDSAVIMQKRLENDSNLLSILQAPMVRKVLAEIKDLDEKLLSMDNIAKHRPTSLDELIHCCPAQYSLHLVRKFYVMDGPEDCLGALKVLSVPDQEQLLLDPQISNDAHLCVLKIVGRIRSDSLSIPLFADELLELPLSLIGKVIAEVNQKHTYALDYKTLFTLLHHLDGAEDYQLAVFYHCQPICENISRFWQAAPRAIGLTGQRAFLFLNSIWQRPRNYLALFVFSGFSKILAKISDEEDKVYTLKNYLSYDYLPDMFETIKCFPEKYWAELADKFYPVKNLASLKEVLSLIPVSQHAEKIIACKKVITDYVEQRALTETRTHIRTRIIPKCIRLVKPECVNVMLDIIMAIRPLYFASQDYVLMLLPTLPANYVEPVMNYFKLNHPDLVPNLEVDASASTKCFNK